jgi:hypothetical protein
MTTNELIKELQKLVRQRSELGDKQIVTVDSDDLMTGFDIQVGYVGGECHVGELYDLGEDDSPEDYEECICLLVNM